MLRQLIKGFQRVLVLQHHVVAQNQSTKLFAQRHLHHFDRSQAKSLSDAGDITSSTPVGQVINVQDDMVAEIDNEYIIPYRVERENPMAASAFLEVLRSRFRLTPADVKRIMADEAVHKAYKERSLMNALDKLCLEGVNKRSFMDYPWLITQEKSKNC